MRTGLIGVLAALTVGGAALASGLLPGGPGPFGDRVRAEGAQDVPGRGGSGTSPADRSDPAAGRAAGRATGPAQPRTGPSHAASPSRTPAAPAASGPSRSPAPADAARNTAPAPGTGAPAGTRPGASSPASARKSPPVPATVSARSAVLALVNQERAKAGCDPVTADAPLTSLAQGFSEDMAARGFFDHTDPDGRTPWDRAARAKVSGLAGENIARGQTDARAVMNSWMHSEGHRKNILDCDFETLGVGVRFGPGGPWWTQDFGR